MYFVVSGTSTPSPVYYDSALTTPHADPVVADIGGLFPAIWLDSSVSYDVTLKNSAGTEQWTVLAYEPLMVGFKSTAQETAASVTPVNYQYAPGYRARYGALADQIAVSSTHPAYITDDETITAAITVPTNAQIYGIGRPKITNSSAGGRVFQGDVCSNVVIDGIRFKGANSSTVPTGTVGSYAATSTGIVTFTNGSDIRITNCEADTFYNGFVLINCARSWVIQNRVTHWLVYGVLMSESSGFTVDHNHVVGCDQAGGFDAYGVMATGDDAAGRTVARSSISFNTIGDIPSWDGIMSHSCSGLRVIGNDIKNVRNGIDISAPSSAQVIRDLVITGNYVESTTTNTWGATPAAHFGIKAVGFDSTHQVTDAVISGNIVRNFYTTAGMVGSGDISNIVAEYAARTSISGNIVTGTGNVISNAGVFVVGDCPGIAVTGNVLEGTMASGGVRFSAVIADCASIVGNTIKQASTANIGVYINGSTITSLALSGNATNSDSGSEFVFSTSTLTLDATDFYSGSATYDPANLADGAGVTTTVTCTGSVLGDFTDVSFSLDLQGVELTSWVSSSNTVSVRFQNETGGAIDFASGTLRVRVRPRSV
jgi:hypothetical protein